MIKGSDLFYCLDKEKESLLFFFSIIQMKSVLHEVDPQVVNWKNNKQEVNNKIVFSYEMILIKFFI
jgi:hypothetical protein